jgi:hypothetical protein
MISLVNVDEIVPIAKKPTLKIEIKEINKGIHPHVREIELIALGQSESGIEFYSWNFDYKQEIGFKADIMIDKEGKQTLKFKGGGDYSIAVKVVDNDGLESVEVIKLKINGVIERK